MLLLNPEKTFLSYIVITIYVAIAAILFTNVKVGTSTEQNNPHCGLCALFHYQQNQNWLAQFCGRLHWCLLQQWIHPFQKKTSRGSGCWMSLLATNPQGMRREGMQPTYSLTAFIFSKLFTAKSISYRFHPTSICLFFMMAVTHTLNIHLRISFFMLQMDLLFNPIIMRTTRDGN